MFSIIDKEGSGSLGESDLLWSIGLMMKGDMLEYISRHDVLVILAHVRQTKMNEYDFSFEEFASL